MQCIGTREKAPIDHWSFHWLYALLNVLFLFEMSAALIKLVLLRAKWTLFFLQNLKVEQTLFLDGGSTNINCIKSPINLEIFKTVWQVS
jgi:hypothetical protein